MCKRPSLWLGLGEHTMSTLPRRVSFLCVTDMLEPFCIAFWSTSLIFYLNWSCWTNLHLISSIYIVHVYDVIAMAVVFAVTAAYKVMLYINKYIYAAIIIMLVYHPSRKHAVTGGRMGENLRVKCFSWQSSTHWFMPMPQPLKIPSHIIILLLPILMFQIYTECQECCTMHQ